MPQSTDEQCTTSDYEIGYGKPPKKTQFKKGQSGNPSGKKQGRKSWQELFLQLLSEYVTLRVDGEVKRMTALQGLMRAQIARAFKTDRGFAQVMTLLKELEATLNAGEAVGGLLVVPAQMALDEWEKLAEEQQPKYRASRPFDNFGF